MQTYLIVPCFNEANRFQSDYWKTLSKNTKIQLIFVNDGSTDGTDILLRDFCKRNRASLINLQKNIGKANAIREGFLQSNIDAKSAVGFLDADSAFTLETVNSFVSLFLEKQENGYMALWSSRVKLAGRQIQRSSHRHYLSRILLTLILNHFHIRIYDTQSGFKIFSKDVLDSVMTEKFRTKWFIDIELFLMYRKNQQVDLLLWEEPVTYWRDVKGSKIGIIQYFSIALEIALIFFWYRRSALLDRRC